MKRVTLLLPDKMIRVFGGSRSTYRDEVEITPESMICVLALDAYHDRFKFKEEDIEIVSIESVGI